MPEAKLALLGEKKRKKKEKEITNIHIK